ncbi:hypothetical protein WJR50_18885 [Catalinimonas sp. 4WD22]|uniref:hypothetical protein n=1 Tax=Catalinimonas locisalis TaxID=3133978 RepID=UPI0031015002
MGNKSDKSLEERILEDIDKTGFITELEIASKFLEKKWSVIHSSTYEDLDYNISREIDLIANFYLFDFFTDQDINVSVKLIIEVKKVSKRPWVIFSSPGTSKLFANHLGWNLLHNAKNHESIISNDGDKYETLLNIFDDDVLEESNYFNINKNYGRAFHESFKAPNEPSKIYESLLTVSKASLYEYQKAKGSDIENFGEEKEMDYENSIDLEIFVPVIILEGNLFEVYLNKNGKKELKRADYIPIDFKYSSPKYKSEKFQELNLYPIIVDLKHLDQFILHMESWATSIKNNMNMRLNYRKSKLNIK